MSDHHEGTFSSMEDEIRFKREQDYRNLAKIPLIEQDVTYIKEKIDCVSAVKNDVDWLKGFFWIIVTAISAEMIGLIFMYIKK